MNFELNRVHCADMVAALQQCPAESFDSMVTDPPYGLSKQPDIVEVLTKWLANEPYSPTCGGFMGKKWDSFVPHPAMFREAFRVLKQGAYGVVFAGARTQDLMCISLRMAGFEIVDVGQWLYGSGFPKSLNITKAIGDDGTGDAKKWDGYGTALKPAYEPWILCRKPLDGTYANNVLTHGCGALNIDGCRAEGDRWPSNVVTTDLNEPWAKYFYNAKASKADRNEGLENFEHKTAGEVCERTEGSAGMNCPRAGAGRTSGSKNFHPTVKPTELMRWLCRLVTPAGGLVLDPFAGSGSTGKAARLEGFAFLGFDLDQSYCDIANARIDHAATLTDEV